ncbi:glycosyltransferase [Terriglobus sp.]|uniref:glycosyltransferase n=1 Tax=Terriglobus sp. TaxID=1889013 RepID=UPI003B00770B
MVEPEQPTPTAEPDFSLRLDGSAPRHDPASSLRPRSHVELEQDEPATHELTVLIPARNEAHNLPACLASLIAQSEPGFELGRQWHIFVIDDDSTDETLAIAQALARDREGLHVLRAPELKPRRHGFTGKNAALWFGVNQPVARTAAWFLFTDADTLHEPATTHRAVVEAERHDLSMLSYSPRQIAANLAQRALLPLIFSELATAYPPKQVNDPSSPIAAANGQFLLVSRDAYFSVGGHQAVADRVLEDVALARLLKRRHAIRLRYAPESVAARMYQTTGEMVAGWTKNLALLFSRPVWLAASRSIDFLLLLGLPLLAIALPWLITWQKAAIWILWLRVILRYWTRTRRSNAGALDMLLAVFALPLFAVLLVRSWQQVTLTKRVTWKGREYTP